MTFVIIIFSFIYLSMFLFEAHFDNQVPVLLATIFNLGFQLIFIGMSLGFILLLKGMRNRNTKTRVNNIL